MEAKYCSCGADYMPFGVAETFQNSFVFPNLWCNFPLISNRNTNKFIITNSTH